MQKSLISLLFILFCSNIVAQRLHTPTEVQQYMKKSSINYSLDSLESEISAQELKLVEDGYFQVITDLGLQLEKREFKLSKTAEKYIAKAEKCEQKNKVGKSIKFLKRANDMHPENMRVLKYLGSLYLENDQPELTIPLIEKVIEINDIDFEAHTLLAAACHKLGQKEKSLEHISLAHLLNRNHPKIIAMMKSIFLENDLVYVDYVFEPQYRIEQKDTKNVSIQANDEPWKSYAACKGLWQYDEGYKKEKMNYANIDIASVEKKECLLNALISYEKMETGKEAFPLLEYLGMSLTNKMVDDFILYEIDSRTDPTQISLLPKERLEKLMKYLTTIRVNREVDVR